MADERVILCEACGQRNRIKAGDKPSFTKCGSCGQSLSVSPTSEFGIGRLLIVAVIIAMSYVLFANESKFTGKQIRPTEKVQAPSFNAPPVGITAGLVRERSDRQRIAKFEIRTSVGSNYFVKLVDLTTNREELAVYLEGGQSFRTEVPLGAYTVRYANGKIWYGEKYFFGPKTAYAKADEEFIFKRQGNQVLGYMIELIPQVDGNLRTIPIAQSQF